MKKVDVYFEDRFIKTIKCDKIMALSGETGWGIFDGDKIVGSIPCNYLLIKSDESETFEIKGDDLISGLLKK